MESLLNKIRALIQDTEKNDSELFNYTVSNIFTISQDNISVLKVLHNGKEILENEYEFDSETNQLTIDLESGTELLSGDKIQAVFNYYNYSENELKNYAKAALVWINMFSTSCKKYDIANGSIFPTPNDDTENLIAIVSSILIKPNYTEYRLPNHTVKYSRQLTKEEKIEKLINKLEYSIGKNAVIEFN